MISADGACVLFRSACASFSGHSRGDGYGPAHLYVRNTRAHTPGAVDLTATGVLPRRTGVSDSDGLGYGFDIFGTGGHVVFTASGVLAPQDLNRRFDVYLHGPLS